MKKAFTLIELLVVVVIIGILVSVSLFGLQNARLSSRDTKRKSDLEAIRSALELYKADCNKYPLTIPSGDLKGTNEITTPACKMSNVYITVPTDPITSRSYAYYSADGTTYTLCAGLESNTTTEPACSGSCGASVSCSYIVRNP